MTMVYRNLNFGFFVRSFTLSCFGYTPFQSEIFRSYTKPILTLCRWNFGSDGSGGLSNLLFVGSDRKGTPFPGNPAGERRGEYS